MSIGQIVYSKAGRDAGKAFIIIAEVDVNSVLLADGSLRRVEAAKKKKVKHIQETDYVDEYILNKITNEGKISNSDVRKAIKVFYEGGLHIVKG